MSNLPDNICRCGHRFDHHERISTFTGNPGDDIDGDEWCATNEDMNCECQGFIPDNLKYLEQKYEKLNPIN